MTVNPGFFTFSGSVVSDVHPLQSRHFRLPIMQSSFDDFGTKPDRKAFSRGRRGVEYKILLGIGADVSCL
jgi:hypothetical protein